MLFISLTFIIFFTLVMLVYWRMPNQHQNKFLLVSSYIFYCFWDWRFLFLLIAYSFLDFFLGKKINASHDHKDRKKYLLLSIFTSLTILGFFKYFNFFVDSLKTVLASFGIPQISLGTLSIILPLGISFFIFKSMSYTIDIYRKIIRPTESLVDFMTYLAFFPQIASGPVERARDFLPELQNKRIFNYALAVDGLRQILWGFFKKIVIADSLATVVAKPFSHPELFSGGDLFLAVIFFAFQIYADFSGYSDIAIGLSKLLGFKPKPNFAYPYFSRSITEFWRRWHISLSTWLRDYVYYPAIFASKNKSKAVMARSIMLTFLAVGLWHGAGWNFVIMGAIFGCYIILEFLIQNRNR